MIEANIILLFFLAVMSTTLYRSNFVKDFSSSVPIFESVLMGSFMRHLRKFVKREVSVVHKKLVVDSDSKLQDYSGFMVS